jgi:glycosyltransferase involved in cell wall biosynthesis
MTPLVSVVIPCYNYGHLIPEAINSVLAQTFTDYEIIVVDGGSTDNTRAVVEQYGALVSYIYAPSPSVNNSRNIGIRAARGQYIAFLDADDAWLPEKLALQVPVIEANPHVGLVYCAIYFFESGTGTIISHFNPSRFVRGKVIRKLYMDQFVGGATPLIRREVFDKVGFFAEERATSDDWEMWLRISAEYEFDFVPQHLALYRIHTSILSSALSNYEAREREMMAFFVTAAERYPDLIGDLMNLRLSTYQSYFGWRLFSRGEVVAGRSRLLNAIRYCPRHNRAYFLLALTYLTFLIPESNFLHSELCYAHGKYYLFSLKLEQARHCFLKSILTNPLARPQPYIGFLMTFAGKRLVRAFRQRTQADFYPMTPPPGDRLAISQW